MSDIQFSSFISLRPPPQKKKNPVISSYCVAEPREGLLKAHFILWETEISFIPNVIVGLSVTPDTWDCPWFKNEGRFLFFSSNVGNGCAP